MAYFSNGTEGMIYEGVLCVRCVHQKGCAVWGLHMMYNYRQGGDNEPGRLAKEILDLLIPREKDGSNGDCRMFHAMTPEEMQEADKPEPHPLNPANKPAPWIEEWLKAKAGAA